jgi:hypothetical protein
MTGRPRDEEPSKPALTKVASVPARPQLQPAALSQEGRSRPVAKSGDLGLQPFQEGPAHDAEWS